MAEVRKAVRYQIKYGARVIKVFGVGRRDVAQPVVRRARSSTRKRSCDAIVDEAHRLGVKVAAHAHRRRRRSGPASRPGFDCIEHGFLASEDTLELMAEKGTFLVSTTALTDFLDVSKQAPEKQAKAAEVFPKAKSMLTAAIKAGVKIAWAATCRASRTVRTGASWWRWWSAG